MCKKGSDSLTGLMYVSHPIKDNYLQAEHMGFKLGLPFKHSLGYLRVCWTVSAKEKKSNPFFVCQLHLVLKPLAF